MVFIEPLNLENWFMGVFAGSPDIFTAVFLFFVAALSGYFRMTGIVFFMMGFLGLIMFSTWISQSILTLVVVLTWLLVGYWISNIVKR